MERRSYSVYIQCILMYFDVILFNFDASFFHASSMSFQWLVCLVTLLEVFKFASHFQCGRARSALCTTTAGSPGTPFVMGH